MVSRSWSGSHGLGYVAGPGPITPPDGALLVALKRLWV